MKRTPLLLLSAILICQTVPVLGEEFPSEPLQAEDQQLTPAEEKFRELLTRAQLVGHYTTWANAETPRKDSYTLEKVAKLGGGLWLFVARIQYGEHDVKLPLPLVVQWAGDTPVITLDNFPVPGFGVFSARIVIHDTQYAGTWDGGDHGGHMYGRIVKLKNSSGQPESGPPQESE